MDGRGGSCWPPGGKVGRMGYREIFDRIDSGDLGGVFVFHGPEEYSKDRALEALRAKLAPPGLEELNYQYLEGERANAAEIRRAAETLPFMAQRRLVVVRDYPMLASSSRGSGLDAAKEEEELDALLANFPSTACLVFLQRFVPQDKEKTGKNKPEKEKNAVSKIVEKLATFISFDSLTEDELIQQLSKIAKRCGCAIRRDAALFMLRYCGTDLEALSRETEKACAHAGPGAEIARADMEAVCVQTQESKVFDFIDRLFTGRGGEAMRSLRALADSDDDAAALLSLIERQARLMAAVKAEGAKADAKALASLLRTPPFAVEAAKRQAARWAGGNLAALFPCARKRTRV